MDRELAGRGDDDGADARFLLAEGCEADDKGQAEGEGFAAARLGDANQVARGEEEGPGGGLDGGWFFEVGEEGAVLGRDFGGQLGEGEDGAEGGFLGVEGLDRVLGCEGVDFGLW